MKLLPKRYFGKITFERSLRNYHISISHHDMGENIPKHSHENPYFSLNLGAAYLEDNMVSRYIVEPGKIILRPANYEHKNTFAKKVGWCFNIEVINTFNDEVLQLFQNHTVHFTCLEFLQILTKTFDDYLDNELDCLITETLLVKESTKSPVKTPVWYKKVISKINEEYSSSLTLNHIAKSVALHPNYLARKFKKINGTTLGDYIRKIRLEKASLMLYSKKRLTDIALESGFYDQAHFSNTFRSTFHISPKTLRHRFSG